MVILGTAVDVMSDPNMYTVYSVRFKSDVTRIMILYKAQIIILIPK